MLAAREPGAEKGLGRSTGKFCCDQKVSRDGCVQAKVGAGMSHYLCAWPLQECKGDVVSLPRVQRSEKMRLRGVLETSHEKVREWENSSKTLVAESHKAQPLPGGGGKVERSAPKIQTSTRFQMESRKKKPQTWTVYLGYGGCLATGNF